MLKKFLPVLFIPLLLTACQTTVTQLTPLQQTRNPSNTYPVEVALDSRQQTLRWSSIQPQIMVGKEAYPMRPTPYMTNRWEGLVPVPKSKSSVTFYYQFNYEYNSMGKPKQGSFESPDYTLTIKEK
jgi:hypothetical protein